MIRTGIFAFIPHHMVDSYHRRGWMIAGDLGRVHGFWTVLMWRCDCGVAN